MSNERHYIGTGAKNCFYTLRYTFTEYGQRSAGDGLPPEIYTVTRDYHLRNLSTNREEAIAKAHEITGQPLTAAFDVCEISRVDSIDWSVLQGGKNVGKSIHELRETEDGKNYLLWLAENCENNRAYAKTVELLKALLAHELGERADARKSAATAKAEKAAATAALLEPIAKVLDGERGDFCKSIAEGMRRGDIPRGRAESIVLDIFAKAHGRRNSKAYNSAFDQAGVILAEAAGKPAPEPFDPMPTVTNAAALAAWNERHGHSLI